MLKNRNIKMIGLAVFVIAILMVTISAVSVPEGIGEAAMIPVTGAEVSLAQYHRSERAAYISNQSGLAVYHLSEQLQAYSVKNAVAMENAEGMNQYHRSEWGNQ